MDVKDKKEKNSQEVCVSNWHSQSELRAVPELLALPSCGGAQTWVAKVEQALDAPQRHF